MPGSPVTRWASVAFGAGIGIGSAYTDCSSLFGGYSPKLAPPKLDDAPAPKDMHQHWWGHYGLGYECLLTDFVIVNFNAHTQPTLLEPSRSNQSELKKW
ncbi:hypothetical protein Gotur_024088 [Gossypium turneri]